MACQVLQGAVTFAVLAVRGGLDHVGTLSASALELAVDAVDHDPDEMRHLLRVLRLVSMQFRDDHCPVDADAHLCSVSFANPRALDEAERRAEPGDCRPHVRVGEDRHDRDWRRRPIDLHEVDPATPRQRETASVVKGARWAHQSGWRCQWTAAASRAYFWRERPARTCRDPRFGCAPGR